MRTALQRLLESPSTLEVLRSIVQSHHYLCCRNRSSQATATGHGARSLVLQRSSAAVQATELDTGKLSEDFFPRGLQKYPPPSQQHRGTDLIVRSILPSREAVGKKLGWKHRLSTQKEYQYESELGAAQSDRSRLIDDPEYAADWKLWLELIRFRKSHYSTAHTILLWREIFRRKMEIPTYGAVGKELWERLIQAGHKDSSFLEELISYAIDLKRTTGRSWPKIYYNIVAHSLKSDPDSAYKLHARLKQDYPPSIKEYQKIFKLTVSWGTVSRFRGLCKDFPVLGLYGIAVPELCRLQMYDEAINWHKVLFEINDLPSTFHEIKPLLAYLAQIRDDRRVEQITRALLEAGVWFSGSAEAFVRKREVISREIMNRQLGEVHGIAPKHLSDRFCARLFATKLFSIDTIIKGLQMMVVESIGPLALREIASRDDCDAVAICRHIDRLKEAGVLLENSLFCSLIRKLALGNQGKMLRSVVECDLHPDTFEDLNLQEKLLAHYYETSDQQQIKRTLAILTIGCSEKDLDKVRYNLLLRCQTTLRNTEVVVAMLDRMETQNIPVTTRSSRHLRVCWLSKRVVGAKVLTTQELTVVINAARNTLLSGGIMPISAWNEIMRRLGMAGRLVEFESLALWLVSWYSSPPGYASFFNRRLLLTPKISPESVDPSDGPLQISKGYPNRRTHPYLKILFPVAAQSAIVAWGFQSCSVQSLKDNRILKVDWATPSRGRPQWAWGLELLLKLRDRGAPIEKGYVARICRQRLNALFGDKVSDRPVNRRAKELNDRQARNSEDYKRGAYVRQMKEIWGEDLFENRNGWGRRFVNGKKQSFKYAKVGSKGKGKLDVWIRKSARYPQIA
ncbi:hypothetical protein MMC28_003243 [Mycoblastus sanguinarius]|nr:hypothetical protein [Mycoblastus sanguinarius]